MPRRDVDLRRLGVGHGLVDFGVIFSVNGHAVRDKGTFQRAMPVKYVTGHQEAVTNLYTDIELNAVVCYDGPDFPASSLAAFYPPAYLAKCVTATVAVSGDATNQRDWMVLCPFRVDESGAPGAKVYDIDPFVVTLDADTGLPAPTGIVAYHQKFEGRTSAVTGHGEWSKAATVTALRQQLVTGVSPLPVAPAAVLNALQHMSQVFVNALS